MRGFCGPSACTVAAVALQSVSAGRVVLGAAPAAPPLSHASTSLHIALLPALPANHQTRHMPRQRRCENNDLAPVGNEDAGVLKLVTERKKWFKRDAALKCMTGAISERIRPQ